jgi:hypothetical protein
MSEFANNDSFLEEVTNIESRAYEQGRAVGITAGWAGDMLDLGCKGGFNKTYPMGLEIGFMEASERYTAQGALCDITIAAAAVEADPHIVRADPESVNAHTGDPSDGDSGGGPSNEGLQERKQRRKEQLLRKIRMLPLYNSSTVDYEAELLELRTLYRLNGSKIGKFLPATAGTTAGSTGSNW